MIESTILTALTADTELLKLVSIFKGQPAIFDTAAPEGATKPYITYRIEWRGSPNGDMMEFSLYTDYWDQGNSRANARKAIERIEFIFDRQIFESERYSMIRVFFMSAGPVDPGEGEDQRNIHYNALFDARACRKKWIDQLK
jgi:hypothetical protein